VKYRPNRNIVRRELDGKLVNVARMRGSLFVCANACCCGRTDLTNAPVPEAAYHREWMERRLRNIVHLTVGGCLGPCALANVALVLFDGEARWFHSVNDESTVISIYNHIEAMLDADSLLPIPPELALHAFTASTWQARPDGEPVEDRRLWTGRARRPDSTPACEIEPADLQVCIDEPLKSVASAALVAALATGEAPPRENGELVFAEPWQARAFGMATALSDSGAFEWEDFRQRLIAAIAAAERFDAPFEYYACWLEALEAVLTAKGAINESQTRERTAEFEFGERQEVF
jgi:nitrile hydratase accessory protein